MPKTTTSRSTSHQHIPMFRRDEISLMSSLIQGTEISENHLTQCAERGLLPLKLANTFQILKFVSRTVLAAQKAQRKYAVPASVLIAMAAMESCYEADDLHLSPKHLAPWQGCQCCYAPDIEKWFLEKAKYLAESPEFRDAWAIVNDVKAYVLSLCSLGLKTCIYSGDGLADDLLGIIEEYELEELDLAGILIAGDYNKTKYTAVRDESGVMQLKPLDLREVAAAIRSAHIA